GDHESGHRLRRRDREREGMKRRLRRRVDIGAYVAARDRIDATVEQPPFAQGRDVSFVEGAKTVLGEWSRRAQFARAERGERPARHRNVMRDALEPVRERHGFAKAHAPDLVARQGRDARGILEYARNVAVAPRQEIGWHGTCSAPRDGRW